MLKGGKYVRWASCGTLPWLLAIIGTCVGCSDRSRTGDNYTRLSSETMGTTYHITYLDSAGRDLQQSVDSILDVINRSMSTYLEGSIIWRVNESDSNVFYVDENFFNVFVRAKDIYNESRGAFNPAVMPLVNYWGFGPSDESDASGHSRSVRSLPATDSQKAEIDSLLALIDFSRFTIARVDVPAGRRYRLQKPLSHAQLDFSAIAKGYAVDEVFQFFESKGVADVMIEIGGEVRAGGNYDGKPWRIGIETPSTQVPGSYLQKVIELDNMSVATSGNYRNFKRVGEVVISHTINPQTGMPERNDLLSASVISRDCMTADALATACMVLGYQQAMELIESILDAEAFFIHLQGDSVRTASTSGFSRFVPHDTKPSV